MELICKNLGAMFVERHAAGCFSDVGTVHMTTLDSSFLPLVSQLAGAELFMKVFAILLSFFVELFFGYLFLWIPWVLLMSWVVSTWTSRDRITI